MKAMKAIEAEYAYHDSPVGKLLIAWCDEGLLHLEFPGRKDPESGWKKRAQVPRNVARQMREYFAGERRQFDLKLAPIGTEFQLRVWAALREIPYGETTSYGELARRLDKPKAMRAVGAANGRNPISIIVPCHRVIGANGSLTGFGGGLDTKRALLQLEGALAVREQPTLF